MLFQPMNGLGESDSVSQTEYDVTAYRNVMDQVKTIRGELDALWPEIRAFLAMHSYSTQKRSGFMMKEKGGKDTMRWGKVVGKELGIGPVREHMLSIDRNNTNKKRVMDKMAQYAKRFTDFNVRVKTTAKPGNMSQKGVQGFASVELIDPGVGKAVTDYLYDIHNLVRNVNWELNRLRIEMPFDLRQLTNQLNTYAQSIGANDDPGIVAWKAYGEIKNLRKKILPTMEKRIREKIKEAKLQEKVAADKIRKENEATLTTAERVEKENREAMDRVEKKGVAARKSGDQFMLSFDGGESWTKISRDNLLNISRLPKEVIRQQTKEQPQQDQPQSSGDNGEGGMTEADIELRDWAHEYEKQRQQRETQKANDEATKTAAEKEGDKAAGNNGAVAAAAGLALLLALGQG